MLKLNSYTTLRSKIIALGFAMALCLSGSSVAAQNSHITNNGANDALGGSAITNTATLTYTVTGFSASTTSNTVTVYVNQIDAFYLGVNDTSLVGTTVRAGNDFTTPVAVAIATLGNTIVNQSNGPITLALGVSAKGNLATALTPYLAGATFQSTLSYYTFTATGTGVSTSGTIAAGTATITLLQGAIANLTVTVTPPASANSSTGWDEFVTTLTDTTTAAMVNSGNAANFTVTQYVPTAGLGLTYAGLDTQVTNEVDIAANANFGKLQLLDPTCGGTAFFTTSVSGNVRSTTSASFPTLGSIVWNRSNGQPSAGTTGLLAVSANPAECIAYQIVINNPLTTGSIPAGASVTDTLNSSVTFKTSSATLTGVAGTTSTTAPTLTTTAALPALGTAVLQYEVTVK